MAECSCRDARECRAAAARFRLCDGAKIDNGGRNFRRRRERFRREIDGDPCFGPVLREHGKPAISFRARRGDDALGDFALKHQHHAIEPRRPRLRLEPIDQKQRRNIVGQVGCDRDRMRARDEFRPIGFQCIARMNSETAGISSGDLVECGQASVVALDRNDVLRAFDQQRARQAAGTGTDFDDRAVANVARRARDLAR